MTTRKTLSRIATIVTTITAAAAGSATVNAADTVNQAVNSFQNDKATGGAAMTVDAKGPVEITDAVELPGFAFKVYDVDFSSDSLTMTLVAQLEKLQITQYDNTTFDRYYYAFDQQVSEAELSAKTDENFSAAVELIAPGTSITTAGAFVDGMATEYTFDQGGILITVGDGTDLGKVSENGGSITVDFTTGN
jgi:hypothetical protein